MHEGRRLRSQIVFRMNGARRTEAFLHEWKDGRWVPVVMPDGTRSDGKTDTYDRCVDGLLGSPETFFTSAFHAQNRRQLSAYRPSEVKGLLVELLGLEQIRATGQHAARVAAQLQQALEERRSAVARHRAMEQSVQQLRGMVEDAQERIRSAAERKAAVQAAVQASLQAAQQQVAAREAERVAAAGVETLRQSLHAQLGELARRKTALVGAQARLASDLKARCERAIHVLRAAEESAAAARARLQRDLAATHALLARQDAIRAAVERLQGIAASRHGLEREAGAATLRVQQLRQRFQLTQEVPCNGTDLQGICKLLADAREAKALQPSADPKIEQVGQAVARLDAERDALERELAGIGGAAAEVAQARVSLDAVIEQRRITNADAALAESVRQAQERLNGIATEAMDIGRSRSISPSRLGGAIRRCSLMKPTGRSIRSASACSWR